ncbi:MAG: signal peptidase II [Clostridia bacterium]|nr:signal peptidase II [Clostridia bacterium]
MITTIIALVCAGAVIGLDQLTKFLIYGTASRSIIGNFLWFESTLNTGVAFSMFEGKSMLFIVISALASFGLLFLICNKKIIQKRLQKICLGLILGGTIGNLIDRIVFDGVRDFIYLKFINFAIFNVADMAIVCSVIVFCVFLIIDIFKKEKK